MEVLWTVGPVVSGSIVWGKGGLWTVAPELCHPV